MPGNEPDVICEAQGLDAASLINSYPVNRFERARDFSDCAPQGFKTHNITVVAKHSPGGKGLDIPNTGLIFKAFGTRRRVLIHSSWYSWIGYALQIGLTP